MLVSRALDDCYACFLEKRFKGKKENAWWIPREGYLQAYTNVVGLVHT